MNACVEWTGHVNDTGYGYSGTVVNGERLAHRIAYTVARGAIPSGLHVDHLCRNRLCVNPDHLEAVTPGENTRRSWAVRDRSTCRRGHEFTPENTKVGSDGYRTCRACYRVKDREAHARKRTRAEVERVKAERETRETA